jgi:glycosyltransferase involved in cell wall biosynthesis
MTRPRKLISIAHSYVVGLNRRLAHELSRAGGNRWEVTAVAPQFFHGGKDLRAVTFQPMQDEPLKVEVVPARMTRSPHLFWYRRKLASLLSGAWDLVHCWEEPYVLAGAQIARATPANAPLVFWTAQNLAKNYPPPFSMFEKYVVRRCAGWMACGQSTLDTMLQREGYAAKPHRILPLGVDVDAFKPVRAAGESIRRKLNWETSGAPVIGYLGRFTEEKGLRLLMNVLGKLDVEWRALFVGAGPLEAELGEWGQHRGERVRICNDVRHDDVPAYLNTMDLLAAPSQTTPSWREQFGRMLIEAFASGVPVIGSDSGEIPYVIGPTGIIAPERDEQAWVDALRMLISSPDKRRELSDAALARVHEQFAWPVIARRYLEFFEAVSESAARRI